MSDWLLNSGRPKAGEAAGRLLQRRCSVEETATETILQPMLEDPLVLEEICVEELAIDGICGVY